MKVVAVSDVHLGSESCEKDAFNDFLGGLQNDAELTDLVLLGDIVDMWRRDASGVFLENMATVQMLKVLGSRVRVHFVAGNHDYHLLRLRNRAPHYGYPFEFKEALQLQDGEHVYRFLHGYELEYGNQLGLMKTIMEALCHLMSDSEGVVEEELWTYLSQKLSDIYYSAVTRSLEGDRVGLRASSLRHAPEVRLKDKLADIERRAHREASSRPGLVYIFGHTHRPFINTEENLVNTGSWVREASPHNTYVELVAGRPRLLVFGQGEVLERLEIE